MNGYVTEKVKEAAAMAKGSRHATLRLMRQWAMTDPDLLRGLAEPFLDGLVGAAVDQVTQRSSAPVAPQKAPPTVDVDALLSRMGQQQATASGTPAHVNPVRQANTMRALAAAFAQKHEKGGKST